ncbi:hypothetical protein CLU96_1447 [Chryseobacterium sp. 52]|uniref:DUF5977 domain-containing protein n=1 Tax=Chryseobacterium sp. 52 TaxID=2035213 RepID=UPI000C18D1D9|nr:DUF5977 domain-containing protein [Chryseobacterium sp. 52]PIF44472.1 hypothetical protein CLU96_1447 [Chryseobacterium sp. 52]
MIRKLAILFFMHLFLLCLTQTKPAESYSLIRGVNENINLNSGTVNLTVPLFDITEGKFTLNNTLNYESRGFVPHITPAYVGLNWNMIQFGKITRESRRIDLTTTSQINNQISNNASRGYPILPNYLTALQYEKYDCLTTSFNIDKLEIFNNTSAYSNSIPKSSVPNSFVSYTAYQKSFDPDKFYFDFMGYKGYFIVDNDGIPIVYCENAFLKVDITNYGFHNIFENINFSEIKLTDDKGNQYFFGGDNNALDISFSFNTVEYESWNPEFGQYTGAAKTKTNYIDSWSLKKIILNDGLEINAYYQSSDLTVLNNYRNNENLKEYISNSAYDYKPNFPSKQEIINSNLTAEIVESFNRSSHNTPIPNTYLSLETWTRVSALTKRAVLDSIKIGNTVIDYKYQQTTNPLEISGKYLTEINIKRNSNLIKKINLSYKNYGNTYKRTFLTNVQNSVGENLSIDYYNTDDFPPYIKAHTNDLGFWNGDMKNYGPYPAGINGYYNSGIEDFTAYDTGLLRKITYPTTGSTSYLYQKGAYSKKYADAFDYSDMPKLKDENGIVNAPVLYKKIEVGNSNQNIETVYKYENDNGTNSGIIEGTVKYLSMNGSYLSSNQNLNPNLNSQNSLHYSTVTVTKPGYGYTKYRFTDRVSNPDSLTNKIFKINSLGKEFQNRDILFLSKAHERGKIIKEELYNLLGIKVKETEYKYKNFLKKLPNIDLLNTNCNTCKVSDANYYIKVNDYVSNSHVQTQYIPVIPYLLVSQTIKEYFGNKVIQSLRNVTYLDKIVKKYTPGFTGNDGYIWYPYPVEDKITTDSKTNIKKYLYAIDLYKENPCAGFMGCNFANDNTIVGGQYVDYQYLHYKNIFNPIIEITKNNENKYSIKENLFSQQNEPSNQFTVLKKVRHSKLNVNVDFTNYNISTTNTLDDINYDFYDNKGNNLQYTPKDGSPVTTIYGYNQTLPIATITGIAYGELMQIFGLPVTSTGYLSLDIVSKSDADKDDASEQLLFNALESFRNNPALVNYQIITYTHNPLIGVTSITPPSGAREVYKYDTANRLETVGDVNNNIIKEYKYNLTPIKFYNSEQSRSFNRNNCAANFVGSTYKYIVPVATFSSDISEIDADQKAVNDINTNGQNMANQNGTCTPIIACGFTFFISPQFSYGSSNAVGNDVNFYISFSSYGIWQSWTNGINVGKVGTSCAPSVNREIIYNEGNRQWKVFIDTSGSCTLRLLSGSVDASSSSPLNFMFQYQK